MSLSVLALGETIDYSVIGYWNCRIKYIVLLRQSQMPVLTAGSSPYHSVDGKANLLRSLSHHSPSSQKSAELSFHVSLIVSHMMAQQMYLWECPYLWNQVRQPVNETVFGWAETHFSFKHEIIFLLLNYQDHWDTEPALLKVTADLMSCPWTNALIPPLAQSLMG